MPPGFGIFLFLSAAVTALGAWSLARMTPLERLAAVKASAVLQETTMTSAAKGCGVSYYHFWLVIRGERVGSRELNEKIANFVGLPVDEVFTPRRDDLPKIA